MKNKLLAILSVLVFIPLISFAQATTQVQGPLKQINNLEDLKTKFIGIADVVIYILVVLAVVFIVYNVVFYLIKGKGEEGRGAAGMNILWGIVGLFIIVSIWGLVNILTNTFGTNNNVPRDRFPSTDFTSNNSGPLTPD